MGVGSLAPDFSLPDQTGRLVRLLNLRGSTVVLFFYAEDDTPLCTKQACGVRDVYADLTKQGAVVLGISPDSITSHARFTAKYQLPYQLLADPDRVAFAAYGTWGEKSMYGRTVTGVHRRTFVIGPDGVIRQLIQKVNTNTHAAKFLIWVSSPI